MEQVITRIKELIAKTPDSATTTITDLQSQLAAKEQVIQDLQKPTAAPSTEIRQAIIKQGQELGLDTQSWTNINSYQELITQQKSAFKSRLNSEISQNESLSQDKNSAQTLNIFLGVLSLGSLLILAYLLIKDQKAKVKKIS